VGGKSYSSNLSLASVLEVDGWVVSAIPWPLYVQETDLVPTVQEAMRAMGASLDGTENLAPTGVQTPDCPACSNLLY